MIVVESHGFPYAYLVANFYAGPAFDPEGKAGLCSMLNRMLLRGTKHHDRESLEEALEGLGTEVSTATQSHALSIGGAILKRNQNAFVDLLGEMLCEPTFPQEELEKVRREMLAELESSRDDDSFLARMWFRRTLFKGHVVGRGAMGTVESLNAITREDVCAHHELVHSKNNMLLGASGDTTEAELRERFEKALADMPEGKRLEWNFPKIEPLHGKKLVLIDKPERTQSQILVGHPSLQADDPDLLALHLAFTAFGGTFTARLMQEVRVKRGWSYGAYARLCGERVGGYTMLSAAPKTEDTAACVELLLNEYKRFASGDLTDEEIEFARGYLINTYPFSLETAAQRAAIRLRDALLGRPDDDIDTYIDRIKALKNDHVRERCAARLTPDDLACVVVSEAAKVEKPLRDLNLNEFEIHDYSENG